MKIPELAITEFKELYQKKFGVELSNSDAHSQALELLTLFKLSKQQNVNL